MGRSVGMKPAFAIANYTVRFVLAGTLGNFGGCFANLAQSSFYSYYL